MIGRKRYISCCNFAYRCYEGAVKGCISMNTETKKTATKNGKGKSGALTYLMPILKGVVCAMVFTILCILAFAFLLKAFSLEDSIIPIVNQLVKIFGILIAAYVATRKLKSMSWLAGGLSGLLYVTLGFLLFSIIDGELGLLPVLVSDMVTGAVIGLVASVIFKSIPKKKGSRR